MPKKVPVSKLREFPCHVRGVNKSTQEYQELVESVRRYGILEPLTVVQANDSNTGALFYGIVHGLHRYMAACDAGVKLAPVWVTEMTDEEIEQAQLIAALHKISVKPVQIAKSMWQVMIRRPMLTLEEMGRLTCKPPVYICERLGINKLSALAMSLVDAGKMCLPNAYALAKLPIDEQSDFIDRALCLAPCEFSGYVMARCRELRQSKPKKLRIEPISIRVLKANEFKTGYKGIEIGILLNYIGTGVVKIVDGYHRFALLGDLPLHTKIKIKVIK